MKALRKSELARLVGYDHTKKLKAYVFVPNVLKEFQISEEQYDNMRYLDARLQNFACQMFQITTDEVDDILNNRKSLE